MKYLPIISVIFISFTLSANSNELNPLEEYATANNYNFNGFDRTKNPKELMFNMTLRCAGFWSSLNEFPKLITKETSRLGEDAYKQAAQIYTDNFSQSLSLFENYEESMLIRTKNTYKKIFEGNLKNRGDHLDGKIGENDLWSCTKFYADISGHDLDSFVENLDPNKPILDQEIPRKNNKVVKTSINHIELWSELFETQVNLWVASGGSKPGSTFHTDQLKSQFCISMYKNPVCPFVDSTKYRFDENTWNQLNQNMMPASAMNDGKIMDAPHIDYIKSYYCVIKHKTTRCFADQ